MPGNHQTKNIATQLVTTRATGIMRASHARIRRAVPEAPAYASSRHDRTPAQRIITDNARPAPR